MSQKVAKALRRLAKKQTAIEGTIVNNKTGEVRFVSWRQQYRRFKKNYEEIPWNERNISKIDDY